MELGKRIASLPSDAPGPRLIVRGRCATLLLPEMMWLSKESLRVLLLNTPELRHGRTGGL